MVGGTNDEQMEEKINTLEPEKLHEYRVLLQRNNDLQVHLQSVCFHARKFAAAFIMMSWAKVFRARAYNGCPSVPDTLI